MKNQFKMTQNTKNIILGVIIGAILVAGGQYAWSKYQANQKAKDVAALVKGLDAAKDKTAYLDAYVSEKAKSGGVSLGFSNSSAYNPDDGGLCEDAVNMVVTSQGQINIWCNDPPAHLKARYSNDEIQQICQDWKHQREAWLEDVRMYCTIAE